MALYEFGVANEVELDVEIVTPASKGSSAVRKGVIHVTFGVPTRDDIKRMTDEEWTDDDVLDEWAKGVRGVGAGSPMVELSPEDGLAAAKKDAYAVPAMVRRFFKQFSPDESKTRTSKRRR